MRKFPRDNYGVTRKRVVRSQWRTGYVDSNLPYSIQVNGDGTIVELSDIADIERTIQTPAQSQVFLEDQIGIALGVFVRPRFGWIVGHRK